MSGAAREIFRSVSQTGIVSPKPTRTSREPVLRYRSDLRTIAFIALYFVALACAFRVSFDHPVQVLVAFAFMCWIAWINAVIAHNVIHVPVWRSVALNQGTRAVLSLAYGFAVNDYGPGHNLSHHRYVQTRRDAMRTTKARLGWNLANLLTFFVMVIPAIVRANDKYVRFAKHARPEWFRERNRQVWLTWGVKIALLLIDWKKALLFVFVPHLGAVWGITTVNYLWHDGCDESHPYNHSRNFVGKVFNWFHFNNGFHGMHHIDPGIHWSLLPEHHAKTIAPFIHPALEQRSFVMYVLRTSLLRGKRVRYDGTPMILPEAGSDEEWLDTADRAGAMTAA